MASGKWRPFCLCLNVLSPENFFTILQTAFSNAMFWMKITIEISFKFVLNIAHYLWWSLGRQKTMIQMMEEKWKSQYEKMTRPKTIRWNRVAYQYNKNNHNAVLLAPSISASILTKFYCYVSSIRLVQLWRSSRHSRLPHGREQRSIELPSLPAGHVYSPLKAGLEYI